MQSAQVALTGSFDMPEPGFFGIHRFGLLLSPFATSLRMNIDQYAYGNINLLRFTRNLLRHLAYYYPAVLPEVHPPDTQCQTRSVVYPPNCLCLGR